MSSGIFILNFIINEIKDNDRYDPHRVRIIGRILYNGNDGGYAVDLLWRCTVVAGNFISIKRFSRKSKPNGSINISLYARVSPTLFPLTLSFSIDLYPPPHHFSRRLKWVLAKPRASNHSGSVWNWQNVYDHKNNYTRFVILLLTRHGVDNQTNTCN